MAATIVSTPATGSSDWTGWITQQGLTDRGFMQVSLTNFATTAASLIGTGSVFELAGSIYSCTETAISLATGTASAAVSVYYVAIPSAGGTTCTFTMNSVAPTWVDAKQGFYASAASTSRYLGGSYIGTAATYYTKFIYTPDMISGYLLPNGKTRPILKKVMDIGDWNMSATTTVNVNHELPYPNIRTTMITIRRDDDAVKRTSVFAGDTAGDVDIEVIVLPSIISANRLVGGFYDTAEYNSTSYNRGWLIIEYEA